MSKPEKLTVAIIGGGPAGLMAAETLTRHPGLAGEGRPMPIEVRLYDAMPSVGRKFLLAGKGGLNLTHAEHLEPFISRYFEAADHLQPMLRQFGPDELRAWAQGLGIDTFVGSSGRVFPKDMKAAPLLRAWLHRLRGSGVQFFMRHRWSGWTEHGKLRFSTPAGEVSVDADVVLLALGGGSWARLGSDGAWVSVLAEKGISVAPLLPSNCGFDVAAWTPYFVSRFAGQPFKSVAISFTDSAGKHFSRKGEFVATATGVEGSLMYAASSLLRNEISKSGRATFTLDLLPDMSAERVLAEVSHPRGSRSLSSHLKSRLNIDGIKASLLHELLSKDAVNDNRQLASAIKALPITLVRTRPIDEAISSAGGVMFGGLTAQMQATATSLPMPVFCAGEMLDWEAPTGGYLLTASFATGVAAGKGVLAHLQI
jgi:uncharacterized flavoprotein (TIGR03862 family)